MKENEWVTFGEELPKLAKEIEVLNCEGTIEKTKALLSNDCESIVFKINGNSYSHHKISRLDGWRYPVEKRPDFSKLRKGNLIVLVFHDRKETYSIFVSDNFKENDLYISGCVGDTLDGGEFDFEISHIKKITRINIEQKTFEEI